MKFDIPFLDVLVIPTGATDNEQRVVIDGVNGRIQWFDANGELRGSIGDSSVASGAAIQLRPDDVDLAVPAFLFADVEGVGVNRQATLYLFGPTLTGSVGPQPAIRIQSDARDGSPTDFIVLTSTMVAFEGSSALATGPVGNVNGKIVVCDPDNGIIFGYIPIYDAIT